MYRRASNHFLSDRQTDFDDWHLKLSVEERKNIRKNIKSAYVSKIQTYEELLEVIYLYFISFLF